MAKKKTLILTDYQLSLIEVAVRLRHESAEENENVDGKLWVNRWKRLLDNIHFVMGI